MSDSAWRVDELEDEPPSTTPASPALVTLHFLLTALRRRWPVWVGLGCVGVLLGLGWALTLPPKTVGTVSLLLAHPPDADPQQALSTDVSLLRTRTLAVDVVEQLDLQMTPEEFQRSVVVLPASTDVLVLEVSGPDDTAAVARAGALADAYLAFRSSQIRSQLEGQTRGTRERISSLRAQSEDLRKQYDETGTGSPAAEQRASALLNQQAQVTTKLEVAQQTVKDATLAADSVIDASFVLDPASRKSPPSEVRAILFAIASGLIGGTATGAGFVLVTALMSNRLRLREEVALALGAPVPISVAGRARASRWTRRTRLPAASLEILVDALDREVARPTRLGPPAAGTGRGPHETTRRPLPTRLALATVDTGGAGQLVMTSLAARLGTEGLNVLLVDLTASGGLERALDSARDRRRARPGGVHLRPEQQPVRRRRVLREVPASLSRALVHRPDRVPSLARGPLDPLATSASDPPPAAPWPDAWDQADVWLTLAEVDPAVGVEHLRSWADEVVVLVAAGRSSAERLHTTGELVRVAGLRLRFAMMVGTDRTDETLGLPETAHRAEPGLERHSA